MYLIKKDEYSVHPAITHCWQYTDTVVWYKSLKVERERERWVTFQKHENLVQQVCLSPGGKFSLKQNCSCSSSHLQPYPADIWWFIGRLWLHVIILWSAQRIAGGEPHRPIGCYLEYKTKDRQVDGETGRQTERHAFGEAGGQKEGDWKIVIKEFSSLDIRNTMYDYSETWFVIWFTISFLSTQTIYNHWNSIAAKLFWIEHLTDTRPSHPQHYFYACFHHIRNKGNNASCGLDTMTAG